MFTIQNNGELTFIDLLNIGCTSKFLRVAHGLRWSPLRWSKLWSAIQHHLDCGVQLKKTNEYTSGKDLLVPLMHYVLSDPDQNHPEGMYSIQKNPSVPSFTLNASSPMHSEWMKRRKKHGFWQFCMIISKYTMWQNYWNIFMTCFFFEMFPNFSHQVYSPKLKVIGDIQNLVNLSF